MFLLPVTKLQTYKTVHCIDVEAALLGEDLTPVCIDVEAALLGRDLTPVVILMFFHWILA